MNRTLAHRARPGLSMLGLPGPFWKTNRMTTLLSLDADLRKSIEDFRQHIRAYQSLLKQQGTWLLLATLGCWSVAHGAFQWAAYAIVLLVFVDRMKARTGDERSFKKIAEAIAQQIHASDLADDTKKRACGTSRKCRRPNSARRSRRGATCCSSCAGCSSAFRSWLRCPSSGLEGASALGGLHFAATF